MDRTVGVGWEALAACVDVPPRFFHDKQGADPGGSPAIDTRAQRWYAGRWCFGCPVMKQCLEANMDNPYGTFGGTDTGGRYVVRQLRENRAQIRRQHLLGALIYRMEVAGYDRAEIAEHLELPLVTIEANVSRWCKTAKGKVQMKEETAWCMLHAGRGLKETALASGLDYFYVQKMRTALESLERGEEKTCRVRPTSELPTAGSVTTAA